MLTLSDGGTVRFPRSTYSRIAGATDDHLRDDRIEAQGTGLHWPEIDEDLSVAGLIRDFGIEH